ncbi:MAG: type II toxin-antitoxin system RelE/ParE family toxin [Gemmatimonadaceae bacterium]
MKEVIWSPRAEERALAVLEYVRRQGAGVAWRWQFRLLGLIHGLPRAAMAGHVVPELERRVRVGQTILDAPPNNCRVIYRVDRTRVVILTLLLSWENADDHERDRHHHGE